MHSTVQREVKTHYTILNTIFPYRHIFPYVVLSNNTVNKYAKLILTEAITNMSKPVAIFLVAKMPKFQNQNPNYLKPSNYKLRIKLKIGT